MRTQPTIRFSNPYGGDGFARDVSRIEFLSGATSGSGIFIRCDTGTTQGAIAAVTSISRLRGRLVLDSIVVLNEGVKTVTGQIVTQPTLTGAVWHNDPSDNSILQYDTSATSSTGGSKTDAVTVFRETEKRLAFDVDSSEAFINPGQVQTLLLQTTTSTSTVTVTMVYIEEI